MKSIDIIEDLTSEYLRWREFLEGLTEDQISQQLSTESLSIKDKVAHLHAWQQLSIARLEAAIQGHDPILPDWLVSEDPDTGDVDQDNERIYQMYRDNRWQDILDQWRTGFEYFIGLCKRIPVENFFTVGVYAWLPNYAIADVMIGSLEHHREHFDSLQ